MKSIIAVISLVLVLSGINGSIINKEKQLATGAIVYLKLRPVDPRSIMQGDYMRLGFEVSDKIINALPKHTERTRWRNRRDVDAIDGFVIVNLDKNRVASFSHLYEKGNTIAENQLKIQYRVRGRKVKFATDAFFFQEGTAEVYEDAKYGQFRVNSHGGLLLTTMHDEDLIRLKASSNNKN